MKKITYNKLVRDKIPEMIEVCGKSTVTKILTDSEYMGFLDAKLTEELNEYQESNDFEELADILEVVYSIAKAKGVTQAALEKLRKDKAAERGGFDKRILLIEVVEE